MSSALRPETINASSSPVPSGVALRMLLVAVARRRTLAHGALNVGKKHCAMGCFWEDHPDLALLTTFVDEVAAVNDLTPRATPKNRWKRVMKWLRSRVEGE